MKIAFNEKTQSIEFKLEDDDKIRYYRIKETLDTNGWKDICDIHAVAREEIISSIKKYSRLRSKRDLCGNLGSMLDGLDQWKNTIASFMAKIETAIEREHEEVVDHGTFNDGD